jgi:hypothetical protein
LLSLLNTTIPALALHENSFLPLINTLWPVLMPRLEDPEAYIVANTLDIVALMCKHAGAFMKTRVEGAWGVLRDLDRRVSGTESNVKSGKLSGFGKKTTSSSASLQILPQSASSSMFNTSTTPLTLLGPRPHSGTHPAGTGLATSTSTSTLPTSASDHSTYRPELYTRTPTLMIRSSLINLFSAIARYVPIQDDLFDQMLDMLDPVLDKMGWDGDENNEKSREIREALESRNADAVWLRLYKKGRVDGLKMPKVPEGKTWVFATVVLQNLIDCESEE